MNIQENYHRVLGEIEAACIKAGRDASEVQLIAVSKTHPVSLVAELATHGQKDFAENRIAELAEKKAHVQISGTRWHLIGQLQTNKVKLLSADVLLHSLDRIALAEKLQQRFAASGETLQVLLQVNCSGEASKSGIAPEELAGLVDEIAAFSALEVMGLMTMAENTENEKTIRSAFAMLRELSQGVAKRGIFPKYQGILSMGMSSDFEAAIAEGATHVRIGSAIFGSR